MLDLTLALSLYHATAGTELLVRDTTTSYGIGDNPTREQVSLLVTVELLTPTQPAPVPDKTWNLDTEVNNTLRMLLGRDAILRVRMAAVAKDTQGPELASVVQYLPVFTKLEAALARLNLRYLQLPYQQQPTLQQVYERADMLRAGALFLFAERRYLDAAAVLLGAERLLTTGGQTPDDFGPLLGGYTPKSVR